MAHIDQLACGRCYGTPYLQFRSHGDSNLSLFLLNRSHAWRSHGRERSILRSSFSGLCRFRLLQPAMFRSRKVLTRFSDTSRVEVQREEHQRAPFHLDLAVLMAGFAFESYNTPSTNVGVRDVDRGGCETVYLSEDYVHAMYDGQLVIELQKGSQFPGLDLWGTSDPYVVFQFGDFSVQSKTIWRSTDPEWNETLILNIKSSAAQDLKVAAWDANVVAHHRRLGNTSTSLKNICDGSLHELQLKLEGMGGGGELFLQVQFKPFKRPDADPNQFSFSITDGVKGLAEAYESITSNISIDDFMKDFQSRQNSKFGLPMMADPFAEDTHKARISTEEEVLQSQATKKEELDLELSQRPSMETEQQLEGALDNSGDANSLTKPKDMFTDEEEVKQWKTLDESISESMKPLGIDMSGLLTAGELGLGFKKKPNVQKTAKESVDQSDQAEESAVLNSKKDIELNRDELTSEVDPLREADQALKRVVTKMDGIVGGWAIFNKSFGATQTVEEPSEEDPDIISEEMMTPSRMKTTDESEPDEWVSKSERGMTTMFSTAETAMEAWALLHTTMGGSSFVKSDFKKICFVENEKTDTQVAIWRDLRRKRLVVAFRGTEQTKWKDMVTDLSLFASGFNPERTTGGDNLDDEPLVHSGFLNAYDSVKSRLLSIIQSSINFSDQQGAIGWHIYVTGHSLGGALATLFALELSSSKLAKDHHVEVTMYNYGSPRVGNKCFAKKYNETVKDSWRIVNSRDIVPSIPRLMGYCHVAQPVYLQIVESPLSESGLIESEVVDDGYQGDVIGETTADVIVEKFMKGEKNILERLFETEIAILKAMRDGSAVMHHMEDFYYTTLLQRVKSRMFTGKSS